VTYGADSGPYRGARAQPEQSIPAAMRFLFHGNPSDILPPECLLLLPRFDGNRIVGDFLKLPANGVRTGRDPYGRSCR
jgi:hypothetical protein